MSASPSSPPEVSLSAGTLDSSAEPARLEARDVSKSFGPVTAVDRVGFRLAPGEFLTVFGPNGAGKTTLLRILGGGLRPSSGLVLVSGRPLDPSVTGWRGRIGVLSHQGFLYGQLTAAENLRFYGRLYGVRGDADTVRAALERVGLQRWAHRQVLTFSRGMRQRLALARTLLHEPDVVLLDEPYTGLDAHAAAVLRDVLSALKDGRRTVVMVTHNLSEGLELADRVAIQVRGRLVHLGPRPTSGESDFARFYLETIEAKDGPTPERRVAKPVSPGQDSSAEVSAQASWSTLRPSGSYLEQLGALAWKDLLVELRTRQRLAAMGTFTVLVGILFNYALDPTLVRPGDVASGLIWMTVIFAGMLGVGRTFQLEAEDGAFQGVLMSPAPKDAVYLGKVASNSVLLVLVVLLVLFVFGLFFGLSYGVHLLSLFAVLALGVIGFVALATLFAAVTGGTSMGETLLPVLVFPLLVPMVIYGVSATGRLLVGRPWAEVGGNVRLLAAFTLVSLLAGAVLFRHVVEE